MPRYFQVAHAPLAVSPSSISASVHCCASHAKALSNHVSGHTHAEHERQSGHSGEQPMSGQQRDTGRAVSIRAAVLSVRPDAPVLLYNGATAGRASPFRAAASLISN